MGSTLHVPVGLAEDRLGEHGLSVLTHGPEGPARGRTLLFVHGAGCGSWFWERVLPYFAQRGWSCVAFDHRGHHRAEEMTDEQLADVTIYDLVEDVDEVAAAISGPVIVVAHSIGGLVALKHAEIGTVQPHGLALLAPAPPANVGGYDFPSYNERWPAPPFDRRLTHHLFFYDIDNAELDRYTGLLGPESVRVLNASARNAIDVNPARVSGPMCVISAEFDTIQGGPTVGIDRAIATCYGADYLFLRGHGHLMLVENNWETAAELLEHWLHRQFPEA